MPVKRKLPASAGHTPKRAKADEDKEPMITSRLLQPRSPPQPIVHTGRKKEVYDMLLEELDKVDDMNLTISGKLEQKAIIAASVGVVCMMDEEVLNKMEIECAAEFTAVQGWPAMILLDQWKNNGRKQTAVARPKEAKGAQVEVAKWYRHKCMISGSSFPTESAHIFSNAIKRNEDSKVKLLFQLKLFWGKEQFRALQAVLADPKHDVRNLIVLNKSVRAMWDGFKFCLRLCEGYTDARQELEFLWLRPGQRSKSVINHDNPDGEDGIFISPSRASHQNVHSGDRIILESSDPAKYPLPEPAFFVLSYNLHMALLCSGGAEVLDRVFRREPPPPMVPANNATDIGHDPDEHVCAPGFFEYLIDSALDLGIIKRSEVPEWRLRFDPSSTNPMQPLYSEEQDESEEGE